MIYNLVCRYLDAGKERTEPGVPARSLSECSVFVGPPGLELLDRLLGGVADAGEAGLEDRHSDRLNVVQRLELSERAQTVELHLRVVLRLDTVALAILIVDHVQNRLGDNQAVAGAKASGHVLGKVQAALQDYHGIGADLFGLGQPLDDVCHPKKLTGFRALYFHYLYLLGKLKKPTASPRRRRYMTDEIIKFDRYVEQAKLLMKYRIDTWEQPAMPEEAVQGELDALCSQRNGLYAARRKNPTETDLSPAIESINHEFLSLPIMSHPQTKFLAIEE